MNERHGDDGESEREPPPQTHGPKVVTKRQQTCDRQTDDVVADEVRPLRGVHTVKIAQGQREGSGGVGRVAGASNRRGVRVEAEVCEDGDDCVALVDFGDDVAAAAAGTREDVV